MAYPQPDHRPPVRHYLCWVGAPARHRLLSPAERHRPMVASTGDPRMLVNEASIVGLLGASRKITINSTLRQTVALAGGS